MHTKSPLLQVLFMFSIISNIDFSNSERNNQEDDGRLSYRKRCRLQIIQDKILYDPVKIMILIYVCNDDTIPAKHISKCKINPSTGVTNYRTDLEFYVGLILSRFLRSATSSYFTGILSKII
jgi:hypothetical protein